MRLSGPSVSKNRAVAADAITYRCRPQATPTAAVASNPAAVVRPLVFSPRLLEKIAPAPRKLTPLTTAPGVPPRNWTVND